MMNQEDWDVQQTWEDSLFVHILKDPEKRLKENKKISLLSP